MRGCFSIEWMAQSSQPAGSEMVSVSAPTVCGTHSESLPGFYSRQKSGNVHEQQEESGSQGLHSNSLSTLQQQNHHDNQVTEASFSSGAEEETSGYESEGGHSLSPSTPPECAFASQPSPPSDRRPRTAFTAEQISSLERSFKRNAYLGTQDKAELCKKLSLSDKQIRNWFQNRRMKLKRTVQDTLALACQTNMASQFMHYPDMQAYRPGPYPRFHSAAAQEALSVASYIHPHNLQYSSRLPSVPALPLDSYQYSNPSGVVLPSATTQLMGTYLNYPQYY